MSSSFGKKYLQSYVDIFTRWVVTPVVDTLYSGFNEFVVNPISKQLLKETGFNLIKWWYQLEDDPDHDNSGMDEDDILSEEDEEYFQYADEQWKGEM